MKTVGADFWIPDVLITVYFRLLSPSFRPLELSFKVGPKNSFPTRPAPWIPEKRFISCRSLASVALIYLRLKHTYVGIYTFVCGVASLGLCGLSRHPPENRTGIAA